MKNTILLASAAFVAGSLAVEAKAVDVEMYGQVNKAAVVYDDGADSEFNVVDNDRSSTRLGWKGAQALDNGLTASVLFEVEMQSNASNSITQNTTANTQSTPSSTGGTFAERHARVGLGGDWGAVFVGQLSTATDGAGEQDLAGASDVLNADIEDIGGGLKFRDGTGAAATASNYINNSTTTSTISANTNDFDGGRGDGIRYDTPIWNGVQGRISTTQGGDNQIAAYYAGKFDEVQVKAGLGYEVINNHTTAVTNAGQKAQDQWVASVTAKHDSGLAGTFAYGSQSIKNKATGVKDPDYWYAKVGYSWDAFEVAADYANHENANTAATVEEEVKYFGLGGQYNMGNGVSTAAFYKNFEYDAPGVTAEDITVYGVNLRVKF